MKFLKLTLNNCACLFVLLISHVVYDIMWKNTVKSDTPQTTKWLMRAFHAGYKMLQTHTRNL